VFIGIAQLVCTHAEKTIGSKARALTPVENEKEFVS
jgi:hypothetical protein